MIRKINKRIILVILLAFVATISFQSPLNSITTIFAKSENTDIKKYADKIKKAGQLEYQYLKAIKKGDSEMADEAAAQLSEYSSYAVEPSAYSMGKARKKAYKKIVKKYAKKYKPWNLSEGIPDIDGGSTYFYGYMLADLDGDGDAELITLHGTAAYMDRNYNFYSYEGNGKVKKYSKLDTGYTVWGRCAHFSPYPGYAGAILETANTDGTIQYSVIKIQNKKLKEIIYGSRTPFTSEFPINSFDNNILTNNTVSYGWFK